MAASGYTPLSAAQDAAIEEVSIGKPVNGAFYLKGSKYWQRGQSKRVEVMRRYSDFEWLQQQLRSTYPVAFIPVLPEKNSIEAGRFEESFIQRRRKALERFIHRLEFANIRAPQQQKKGFFSSAVSQLSAFVPSGSKPVDGLDEETKAMRSYFIKFEEELNRTRAKVDRLVRRRKELGNALQETATSLTAWNMAETKQSPLSSLFVQVAVQSDKAGKQIQDQSEAELCEFLDFLDDYCRLIGGVKEAFKERIGAESNLRAAIAEERRIQRPGAQGGVDPQALGARIAELRAMSEEYGKFLKGEVERFHHEKVQDFSQALNDFVQIQVASGSKVQEYWQSCFSGSRAATEPPKPRDLAVEDMAEDIQDMQG